MKRIWSKTTPQVRILAILGNSEGIDTERDRALLEQLPDAEVILGILMNQDSDSPLTNLTIR